MMNKYVDRAEEQREKANLPNKVLLQTLCITEK